MDNMTSFVTPFLEYLYVYKLNISFLKIVTIFDWSEVHSSFRMNFRFINAYINQMCLWTFRRIVLKGFWTEISALYMVWTNNLVWSLKCFFFLEVKTVFSIDFVLNIYGRCFKHNTSTLFLRNFSNSCGTRFCLNKGQLYNLKQIFVFHLKNTK